MQTQNEKQTRETKQGYTQGIVSEMEGYEKAKSSNEEEIVNNRRGSKSKSAKCKNNPKPKRHCSLIMSSDGTSPWRFGSIWVLYRAFEDGNKERWKRKIPGNGANIQSNSLSLLFPFWNDGIAHVWLTLPQLQKGKTKTKSSR